MSQWMKFTSSHTENAAKDTVHNAVCISVDRMCVLARFMLIMSGSYLLVIPSYGIYINYEEVKNCMLCSVILFFFSFWQSNTVLNIFFCLLYKFMIKNLSCECNKVGSNIFLIEFVANISNTHKMTHFE